MTIHQDQVLAQAESFDEDVITLFEREDDDEYANYSSETGQIS